jgi:IclR family mhp operon transcriptional activator
MDSTRPIRALTRGLDALTVLNLRDGATVSEIAHEIRLPRTTIYRILETLCDSGFVYRDSADERYRLTILVRGLSDGFDDEAWVTQIAKPFIFELTAQIVWPVCISTLSSTKMIVREVTDHSTPLALQRHSAGMRLPLLSSAAGRVYLAHCASAQRDALIEMLARSGKEEDKPARSRAELLRGLEDIKAQGHSIVTRTLRLTDEVALSVAVMLHDRPLASLTLRYIPQAAADMTAVEGFLPRLRQCAAKISDNFSQQHAHAHGQSVPEAAA